MQSGLNRNGGAALLAPPTTVRRRRRVHRTGPRIAAVAVSDSETVFTQEQVLDRLGLRGDAFAEGIFGRCGVRRRHLNLDEDFLARSLQERTPLIERDLLHHSIAAVERLGIDPRRIATVVSASLYSLGCPSLAHRLLDHFEMDPCTDKYHVSGVGCASGVPLMRLTAQALREHADRPALVLAAESMSGILTPAAPGDPRAKTVGSAIFGDGCAAVLLSGDPDCEGPAILASQVQQIGGTLDAVSLRFSSAGSYLHLAVELPDLAAAGLAEVVDAFLLRNGVDRSTVDHWIVHPGGRRIVESIQGALDLSDEDVQTSWRALAEHGNVGTPSIFYVLKDTIERCRPEAGEHGLIVTIGPGVTVGMMLLGW